VNLAFVSNMKFRRMNALELQWGKGTNATVTTFIVLRDTQCIEV